MQAGAEWMKLNVPKGNQLGRGPALLDVVVHLDHMVGVVPSEEQSLCLELRKREQVLPNSLDQLAGLDKETHTEKVDPVEERSALGGYTELKRKRVWVKRRCNINIVLERLESEYN